MPFLAESLRRWCACDCASTRQFALVSSLSAVREISDQNLCFWGGMRCGMEGERKSKGERGQGTGRWHTRGGRVVGGDRRIPSYGGDYRYAREDKGVEVQLLLFESFGGFGKGVREILRKAADVLQNKLTRAQYLDEVTWTTKNWLGLQKQRISVVLHTAIAEQIVNELACGGGGRVHGAKCLATLAGVA